MSDLNEKIDDKSLEYWLSRATDPFSPDNIRREDAVRNFYERVNLELEGQLVACRLLAHKIQSPHEKEALNALQVLDACVRNCGQRFHNEMAKFKFLNEIIKILSPKYLGNQTSENVKKKAIESLYSWKMTLKHLPKIKQAYDMLKEQGIVLQDPTYVDEIFEPLPAPPAKPKLATFEDDEKARLLSQLLKSKNPDDIQAANRLIKNMVKAEDQKMEKMSKRCSDLTTAANNARLLQEMLHEFNKSTTMQQEIEIMKELADSLVKLRPALFRYAGESSENDEEVLAEVLNVNDEVGKALDDYKFKFEQQISNFSSAENSRAATSTAGALSSLLDLETNLPAQNLLPLSNSSSCDSHFLTGDDVLMLGGGGTPLLNAKRTAPRISGQFLGHNKDDLNEIFGVETSKQRNLNETTPAAPKPKGLLDLDALSEALIQQNLPSGFSSTNQQIQAKKLSLQQLLNENNKSQGGYLSISPLDSTDLVGFPESAAPSTSISPKTIFLSSENPRFPPAPTPHSTPQVSHCGSPAPSSHFTEQRIFDDIFVALESVKPSNKESMLILNRNFIQILMHYTSNKPLADVNCVLFSISSNNQNEKLTDVKFFVRVLNSSSQVKMQPPSGDSLAAFNPLLPPSAISQILLIKSKNRENIPVEYTLQYTANQEEKTINGIVEIDCS